MISDFYNCGSNSDRYIAIPQHCYGYTDVSRTAKALFFSHTISQCAVVTFHDPKRKIGVFAHFDTLTEIDPTINKIIKKLQKRGADVNALKITVIGGANSNKDDENYIIDESLKSQKMIQSIKKALVSFSNVTYSLFEKQLPTRDDYEQFDIWKKDLLHLQQNNITKGQDQLINNLDSLLSLTTYSQILFDVTSGEVKTSSQYCHLLKLDELIEEPSLTLKAKQVFNEQLAFLKCQDGNNSIPLKKGNLIKVFDSNK